ncbi:hypothetical protein [Calothrix sp. PCC 6303]|uniref:hypothetical protein n=1 Tax=Calothrix sp. PCC 6303 TaxID=1170562 RepID=UPI0002A00778|nr:hypothetical protein [Calothrix sp. PCC 6303]AFZ00109.1 hypothetical protein Cal6303_1046 [Calothrix sp. PCC 6303]
MPFHFDLEYKLVGWYFGNIWGIPTHSLLRADGKGFLSASSVESLKISYPH